ncbi:MAG TPA: FtsX-like permease family protein [Ktedonobacterales bacterium]|nr:FtsX-like permease family protein [Ktedonobacterales bacterium]
MIAILPPPAHLRLALVNVTRRKGRTLLVTLSLFIGVAGLTALNVTQDALVSAFAYSAGLRSSFPDVVVQVDALDDSVLPAIAALPNVRAAQAQSNYQTSWQISDSQAVDLVIDSYPDLRHITLGGFELTAGRYPGAGEIVLDAGDQTLHPVAIGDTITVQSAAGAVPLHVVGLTRTPGEMPGATHRALGYMSDAALAQLAGAAAATAPPGKAGSLAHSIAIKVRDQARAHTTAADLARLLAAHGVLVLSTDFPSSPASAGTLAALAGIFALLRALAAVAVLLSGLLIANTIMTLMTEQITIVGTLKALGGTRGVILRGYLLTVSLYGLLGTPPAVVVGMALGRLLAAALAPQIPLTLGPPAIEPWIVALSLATGLLVPLLAALVPLWVGTSISVRAALATYGVSVGPAGGALARLSQRLRWVRQTTWLGLRGALRRRARAAVTLVTLTFAGASFLVVQTASASVNQTMGAVGAHSAVDLTVNFASPTIYATLRDQLSALPNVGAIERTGGGNVATAWGTLQVYAFEPRTRLYHERLTSGRWFRPGERDVVLLSDAAARRAGLRLGDQFTITNNFGASTQLTVTLIGTVDQAINVIGWIGAAVVPVDTMYILRGVAADKAAAATEAIGVGARDRSPGAVNQLAAAVNAVVNPHGSSADGQGYYAGAGGTVDTAREYATRRQGSAYILYYLLYAVALIVGVVGALGLANALVASVLERRREIGLLRALGARGGNVAGVFWTEGLALGGLAWCAGVILGVPLALLFVRLVSASIMPVEFTLDPLAFGVMLLAIIAIATLASAAPAWRATRGRAAELLRYE